MEITVNVDVDRGRLRQTPLRRRTIFDQKRLECKHFIDRGRLRQTPLRRRSIFDQKRLECKSIFADRGLMRQTPLRRRKKLGVHLTLLIGVGFARPRLDGVQFSIRSVWSANQFLLIEV